MTAARRSNVITAAIFFAALLVFSLLFARLAGAGVDAGDLAVTDAGMDRVVLADHAPPDAGIVAPSAQPHADPAADPGGIWSEFQALRKKGGPQLAFGFLVAIIGTAVRERLRPAPGEDEPDPKSWRARTIALLGAAVAISWGLADRAAGAISWSGLMPIALGAAMLVWHAINPPKGAKAKPSEAK